MEKREAVARAICEDHNDRAGFWDTTPESRRKGYYTLADAAIAALEKWNGDNGLVTVPRDR